MVLYEYVYATRNGWLQIHVHIHKIGMYYDKKLKSEIHTFTCANLDVTKCVRENVQRQESA